MDLLLTPTLLENWLLVFARLLGWAWVDPLMGRLPWSLRLFVAGALAWMWVPALPGQGIDPFTPAGMIALALSFLTGAAMGFASRLLVAVAETALPMVGLTASLGLSQVVPEQKGGLDPVLLSLAWWLALLAFFSANGHLLVVQAVDASFVAIPPAGLPDAASLLELAESGSMLLAAALQLALPLLVLVLLAHFAFLVLSRILPGADAFSMGLTLGVFTLLGGLALAVPVLVSGLAGLFVRLMPQLMP
jgi:flagellar biosynthetic protein FliR